MALADLGDATMAAKKFEKAYLSVTELKSFTDAKLKAQQSLFLVVYYGLAMLIYVFLVSKLPARNGIIFGFAVLFFYVGLRFLVSHRTNLRQFMMFEFVTVPIFFLVSGLNVWHFALLLDAPVWFIYVYAVLMIWLVVGTIRQFSSWRKLVAL